MGNRGAQTYFVSVGPVQNDPYCSNAEIESFNAAMQANLSGVTYIDVYSHLVSEGFSTVDGTHYPDSVSVDIIIISWIIWRNRGVESGDDFSVYEIVMLY